MGITEQMREWEELRDRGVNEQIRAEQEVFNGLNSTDTILNLAKECMQFLSDISVRQDGIVVSMEDVIGQGKKALNLMSEEEVGRLQALERIAGYVVDGSTDLMQVATMLQAIIEEAGRANEVLHQLEEHLVEYADANEKLYEKMEKGDSE